MTVASGILHHDLGKFRRVAFNYSTVTARIHEFLTKRFRYDFGAVFQEDSVARDSRSLSTRTRKLQRNGEP